MKTCSFDALDALSFNELPEARAAEVATHVAACRMCELQLRRLREDRSLLSARSRHTLTAPAKANLRAGLEARLAARGAHLPDLHAPAVRTERSEGKSKSPARTRRPLLGALAAAAVFAVLLLLPSRQAGVQGARVFELAMSSMDPSLVCRMDERAVSNVESRYGACLVATPRALPDEFGLCL